MNAILLPACLQLETAVASHAEAHLVAAGRLDKLESDARATEDLLVALHAAAAKQLELVRELLIREAQTQQQQAQQQTAAARPLPPPQRQPREQQQQPVSVSPSTAAPRHSTADEWGRAVTPMPSKEKQIQATIHATPSTSKANGDALGVQGADGTISFSFGGQQEAAKI